MAKMIILKVDKIIQNTGLSKVKFAETVGIRPNTICDYTKNDEKEIDKVSLRNLAKIAEIMDIDDISQLMEIVDIED